jgi:hypothetical protein
VIIQAPGIPGDAVRMNHINGTPAGTPTAWQTLGGSRAPGANDTTGSPAGAHRRVSGRFVKENPPSA